MGFREIIKLFKPSKPIGGFTGQQIKEAKKKVKKADKKYSEKLHQKQDECLHNFVVTGEAISEGLYYTKCTLCGKSSCVSGDHLKEMGY